MNNVLNRKMFVNRDARAKLANMGGILASSPEMVNETQRFAPGGTVDLLSMSGGSMSAIAYLKANYPAIYEAYKDDPEALSNYAEVFVREAQRPESSLLEELEAPREYDLVKRAFSDPTRGEVIDQQKKDALEFGENYDLDQRRQSINAVRRAEKDPNSMLFDTGLLDESSVEGSRFAKEESAPYASYDAFADGTAVNTGRYDSIKDLPDDDFSQDQSINRAAASRYDFLKDLPDDANDLALDQYDLDSKERDRFVKSSSDPSVARITQGGTLDEISEGNITPEMQARLDILERVRQGKASQQSEVEALGGFGNLLRKGAYDTGAGILNLIGDNFYSANNEALFTKANELAAKGEEYTPEGIILAAEKQKKADIQQQSLDAINNAAARGDTSLFAEGSPAEVVNKFTDTVALANAEREQMAMPSEGNAMYFEGLGNALEDLRTGDLTMSDLINPLGKKGGVEEFRNVVSPYKDVDADAMTMSEFDQAVLDSVPNSEVGTADDATTSLTKEERLLLAGENKAFREELAEQRRLAALEDKKEINVAGGDPEIDINPEAKSPITNLNKVPAAINAKDIADALSGVTDTNAAASDTILSSFGTDPSGMSMPEKVKEYKKVLSDLMGDTDEDRKEEFWMNMAMVGFGIAAGDSPNALKNIADGLLAGTSQMSKNKATRKARDDKFTLTALGEVLTDERADKKFSRDVQLAQIRASKTGTREPFIDAVRVLAQEGIKSQQYRTIEEALSAASKALAPYYGDITIPSIDKLKGTPLSQEEAIKQYKALIAKNPDKKEIALKRLIDAGYDTKGLT
jgi:hypothetical protein